LLLSREHSLTTRLRAAVLLGCCAVATFAPWLVRNGVETGNPVYPYLFTSHTPYAEQQSLGNEIRNRYPEGSALPALAAHLADGPRQLLSAGLGVAPYVGAGLFIPLPFLLLCRPLSRRLVLLLAIAGCGFVLWNLTVHLTRYALPFLALLAVPAACVVTGTGQRDGQPHIRQRHRWLLGLLVAISLLHNLFIATLAFPWGDLSDLLRGHKSRDQYLAEYVSYYDAATWANTYLKADDLILFFGESRGYYCDIPHVTTSWTRLQLLVDIADKSRGQPLGRALRARGFTHILVSLPEIERLVAGYGPEVLRRDDPVLSQVVDRFLENGIEPLYDQDGIIVARIRSDHRRLSAGP
jgi:hypothetical protein